MKKPDRITAIFGAVVLTAVLTVGAFSALATGGDQSDPLITLSYLKQVFKPELQAEVDGQITASEQALTDKFDAAMDDYSLQIEQALNQSTGESAGYIPVSVSAGQALCPSAGGELLLRSGEGKVSDGTSSALLDTTTGGDLAAGGSLNANHLYVASADGAEIAVLSDAVFLVRGAYSIS